MKHYKLSTITYIIWSDQLISIHFCWVWEKIRNNRKQVSTIITPALLVVIEYPDNIIRQNVDGFVK